MKKINIMRWISALATLMWMYDGGVSDQLSIEFFFETIL